jgi:holo-[acyl-carrier protein] synthase
MTGHVHLTMTDDHPYAQAFVIIEALPDDSNLTRLNPVAGI